jgi:hypothetical protein
MLARQHGEERVDMVKSYEVVHLQPDHVRFVRQGDTLSLAVDDVYYPRVVLRRCFPVSQSELLLSVRDATSEEQAEVGLIEDWSALHESDRAAVAAELGLHYFVPQISQVHSVRDEFGFLYWSVDTDKGPKEFVMRNSVVHYAREVAPRHWLLIDVNQARYEIEDVDALEQRSQKIVKRALYL